MGLNKVKHDSNMYPFLNEWSNGNGYTWNPIRGKCPHSCVYCYMKRKRIGDLRFEEKELKTDLGEGRFIFVGSSTDMFADIVSPEWIKVVIRHCCRFHNTYLFQTKNPKRFIEFLYPITTIFGTTIETNRETNISIAPKRHLRRYWISKFGPRRMISIEPILDFDLEILVPWIKKIKPEFVSMGADSKGHNLPEPTPDKVNGLIEELGKFTEVKIKANLKRLMK